MRIITKLCGANALALIATEQHLKAVAAMKAAVEFIQRDGQLLRCVPKTLIPAVIVSIVVRFSPAICWLYLPKPDSFAEFVEKVELAFLQQVHSKLTAVFHLTNQFCHLI